MDWSVLDANSYLVAIFHDGFQHADQAPGDSHGYLRLIEMECTGEEIHDNATRKVINLLRAASLEFL